MALACLPSSKHVFLSESLAQEPAIHGADAGEENIPTPSSGAVNSNTFMKAVSKLKGEKSWDSGMVKGDNFENGEIINKSLADEKAKAQAIRDQETKNLEKTTVKFHNQLFSN